MKARIESLPAPALVALTAAAVLVYFAVVWFLVVSPKRADASSLAEDVVAAELELAGVRLTANRPQAADRQASDVLLLAKAMPSTKDQPGLVLELDRLARSTGVRLESITPQVSVFGAGGPTTIPVVVTAEGSYQQITRFLRQTKDLVRVRGRDVRAIGRLFAVQAVELSESKSSGFPSLDATITLNAFVYDGPIVPVAPPPSTADDVSTGTSAARSTP